MSKQLHDAIFLAAANAAGHQVIELAPVLAGNPNRAPGILCAANEASYNATFMSEPLTTYIQGMPDQDNVQAALDYIAPTVPSGRRFEYRGFGNAQQMLSETDDVRGIGANFKAVEFSGALQQGRTVNKGLAYIGDLDVLGEIPNWEQLYANWLRVRCLRNELRRAVTALLAMDAGTTVKWIATPSTDPDTDLMNLVANLGDVAGLDANALAIGLGGWIKRVTAYSTSTSLGAFARSGFTPQQLGEWLECEFGVRKFKERFATGAGTKTRMLSDYAVAFHRTDSPIMEDPSSIKRFVTTTNGLMQVFRRELSAKLVEISVSHYSNIITTGVAKKYAIT